MAVVALKRQLFPIRPHAAAKDTPFSTLWSAAKSGQIDKALIAPAANVFYYQTKQSTDWNKSSIPPKLQSSVLETLRDHAASVSALPESVWSKLSTPLLAALPFLYLYFLYRIMHHIMGTDDQAKIQDAVSSSLCRRITFQDVVADQAVRELSDVVGYLRNSQLYQEVGAQPPKGILLHGPSGTGKTLLARAVAGEARVDTFLATSGSDFVDTFVGRGASRVRKLFAQARKGRGSRTAIIFLDEIDAVAKARSSSSLGNDERDQTLNQLLTEMDGFASSSSDNGGSTVIVIAATNRPDVLDPAFLRRMDRQIAVGLPTLLERMAILQVHAKSTKVSDPVQWRYLAEQTDGFCGAELKTVMNEAALLAIRQRGSTVYQHHILQAIEKVKKNNKGIKYPHLFAPAR